MSNKIKLISETFGYTEDQVRAIEASEFEDIYHLAVRYKEIREKALEMLISAKNE